MSKVYRFTHYSDFPMSRWRWPHFTPYELSDKETDLLIVVPSFLDWLEGVRVRYGKPMTINDATREPDRQERHSGRRSGSHVAGMAVDVKVSGADALHLIGVAARRKVLGLGVYQGLDVVEARRFIHLDRWTTAPRGVRPNVWTPARPAAA